MPDSTTPFDVIVIGGGHAGVEAAWAAANIGARVALVTLDPAKIGVMSCNPAIGGLAKGQIVREIDALGGLMGLATDATGIMFKVLNESRGAAIRSPRAQCDMHAYARCISGMIASHPGITVVAGSAEVFHVEHLSNSVRAITGIDVTSREPGAQGKRLTLRAPSVVVTTGTFMRGLMHTGESKTRGGRAGEAPAVGISAALTALGFELGRLKTGTPPRVRRSTIEWDALPKQLGDNPPTPFSDLTDRATFPAMPQVACRITQTTREIHEHVRANLDRAPMFNGQITTPGPRYCPSIEDKVVRFSDRESHHVFLEPESHETERVYCNGIATSLPRDVQDVIVRGMPGCAHAEIMLYGYAVEYDMVRPHQIEATCMTKLVGGLFLAGQINGTSGYEEAAGQGVIAGVNAARWAQSHDDEGAYDTATLGRDEAYIGVLMDDLVTKTPVEPYRMFTSRAEHRLILRADNTADRLTPIGERWGTVARERVESLQRRRTACSMVSTVIDGAHLEGVALATLLRRPRYSAEHLSRDTGLTPGVDVPFGVLETVLAERQYEGYIKRQRADIKRRAAMEHRQFPVSLDVASLEGLRTEAKQALATFKPTTFGQAGRLEGVSPADLTLLIIAADRRRGRGAVDAAST